MKVDIRTENDRVFVVVPYKNGTVTWALDWSPRVCRDRWSLAIRSSHYNPDRVTRAHEQFLRGKWLRRKLIKYAAASHKFNMLHCIKDWLN